MSTAGRGVVCLSATAASAADWVRRGVVPCHVLEHASWSVVVPARAASAAAAPYDDALTVLASRHVGPRLSPAIGLFRFDDVAVVTARAAGRAQTRWALRDADGRVVGGPDLPPLSPDDLHRALASGAPARRVPVREVRDLWRRGDLSHDEWLVEVTAVLGLPGGRVLDGTDTHLGPVIAPHARSVTGFESVVKDVHQ
ncbi:hypothetical protein O9K63_05840 [Janibacter cremeus]|uniref:hypothetical protein n=1 Tax=Janibacter cremeus TaxID=1285192 RepID=UPI0023F9EBE8|nr:hypothetical protein [Janibacter cremeus]WEV79311.1 hypothetical protein O9K63_05840 [Janibacter cremeus]